MADDIVPIRPGRKPQVIGTVGGQVDEMGFTLAIYGDTLDPDDVSRRLGCAPTSSPRAT